MFLWVSLFTFLIYCLFTPGGQLSTSDKAALVALLKTLTDPQYLAD
jgi:hypothetical protein